ncbi:hypothetical protein HGRIS_002586 [Hohenbuehelia grisea]|uniref:UTP--glucose-1-phosphate uridylyltransferase n=1 Tax=Hohenbuehelia grisea TaxID=104357 RepID=A0ABR3JMB8_9AGAR
MAKSEADFIMEVTDRTRMDLQGGVLIENKGIMSLLEPEQVSTLNTAEFQSTRNFKHFNTNNLWINLKALRNAVNKGMDLDILVDTKQMHGGQTVIQLETAAGSAIKYFANTYGISVPRSRYLPAKTCADLLLIRSDIFSLNRGRLVLNPERAFGTIPVIKLGDHFKKDSLLVASSSFVMVI